MPESIAIFLVNVVCIFNILRDFNSCTCDDFLMQTSTADSITSRFLKQCMEPTKQMQAPCQCPETLHARQLQLGETLSDHRASPMTQFHLSI